MWRIIILCLVIGIVGGGRSLHAKYVEELYEGNKSGKKYPKDVLEDAKLDVPSLVAKYGYPIEIHNVTTADGYILTTHRIPHGRTCKKDPNVKKPTVFLMHGLPSSSIDYLILGPQKALGYYLADEGYDVWIGNARGNFYSRNHQSLDPDNKTSQEFWKFSWDEIGNYDLPAFVDHILNTTKQTKLHYIGHSQGGTSFLVLNALRPEYNEKFISFQGFAPAAFFTHNHQKTLRAVSNLEDILETVAFSLGIGEVFGTQDFITWFIRTFCKEGSILNSLCESILVSRRADRYNENLQPLVTGHVPAGASIRQFAHFAQSIRFDTFRRYNYDKKTNFAKYGSWKPPNYDLSKITVPSYIYFAPKDTFVAPKDIQMLCNRLPNVGGCYLIQSKTFDHLDFIWGSEVKALLYEKVLKRMRDAEHKYYEVKS